MNCVDCGHALRKRGQSHKHYPDTRTFRWRDNERVCEGCFYGAPQKRTNAMDGRLDESIIIRDIGLFRYVMDRRLRGVPSDRAWTA